ncbi:hypothetical protein ARMGADRAFT_1019377, partial [Armillaria gallica]
SPSIDISRIVSPLETQHGNVRQRESTGSRPSFTADSLPALFASLLLPPDLITWTLYSMYPTSGDFCFKRRIRNEGQHMRSAMGISPVLVLTTVAKNVRPQKLSITGEARHCDGSPKLCPKFQMNTPMPLMMPTLSKQTSK